MRAYSKWLRRIKLVALYGGGGCVGLFVILFIVALVMSNKDKTASESPAASVSDSGSAPEARPHAPIGNPPLAPDRPFVAALEAWTDRTEAARQYWPRRAVVGRGVVVGGRDRYTGGVEAKPAYYIGGLPVEKKARIAGYLKEDGWRLVKAIQRAHYPCDTLSSMVSIPLFGGYMVSCNNDAFTYEVAALSIKAAVTVHKTR